MAVVPMGALLLWTGYWRWAMVVFAIRPGQLTVKKLGLLVESADDVQRVDTILASFASGFNAMLTRPTAEAVRSFCASLPPLYRPFAEEGQAMGYLPRKLGGFAPADFETNIVKRQPEFRYLYYVGLGFWAGMRNYSVQRLRRMVDGLDPLYGNLCFDGYGFQRAFFHYPKNPQALRKLDELQGYDRSAAYHGVGRAFWFLYMARPEVMVSKMASLGSCAADVAAGVGLAAVFVNPDRLASAQSLAREMPEAWQPSFHLGMCFGLKARSINDNDEFQTNLAGQDESLRDAALASIRECDRIEMLVRAESVDEPYLHWRERVTDWLSLHVEYPMAGLCDPQTFADGSAATRNTGERIAVVDR
jgi:hypothetical protein